MSRSAALLSRFFPAIVVGVAAFSFPAVLMPQDQQGDPEFDASVKAPAFTVEHPLVLVDAGHRNAHRITDRYKAFADVLTNDGLVVSSIAEKFTDQALAPAKVLVIANARGAGSGFAANSMSAFTQDEIQAVRHWVEKGGALFLIADHAPMGAAASDLARSFGVEMSKGYVEDLAHTLPEPDGDHGGTIVFSRENRQLLDHAITAGRNRSERITVVYSFTGQAVRGPKGSWAILKLADTAADRPASLLPPQPGDPPGRSRIGIGEPVLLKGWSQMLALSYGKGRVVVGGEAGMFSAQVTVMKSGERIKFGMNKPGIDNKQLLLNTLRWLAEKRR